MTIHQFSMLIEGSSPSHPVFVRLRDKLISLQRDKLCNPGEAAQILAAMYAWWPSLSPIRLGGWRRDSVTGSIARLILEHPGISTAEIIRCLPDARATAQSIRQIVSRMIRKQDILRHGHSLYLTISGRWRTS
jgi:hypothetical protein